MDSVNYFNEEYYLSDNNTYEMECINREKDKYIKDIRKNAFKYGSNIQAYDEYTTFIAYLVKCLGIPRDTLNVSMILNILTKKGVFSKDYKIDAKVNPGDDVRGFLGINVVNGRAACRHISSFQSDVIKKLDLMSDIFFCYLSKCMIDNTNGIKANHAINLIEYKDNLYGYDALNNSFYRFIGNNELREIYTNNSHYIYYKPYMYMIFGDMDAGGINSMLSLFDVIKDKEIITLNEYKEVYENAKNAVNKNSELLDDFHESSKKYIKRITKNL